jgi:alkylhydroperoxidase family enzyme
LFTEDERAALRFAQSAAAVPNAVSDEDFVEMGRYFTEEQIVEILGVIAFYGFLNRWNDTLATELESKPLSFGRKHLAAGGWSPGRHAR